MNLAWIAALTVIVLAEKALGRRVSYVMGAAAMLSGGWLLLKH